MKPLRLMKPVLRFHHNNAVSVTQQDIIYCLTNVWILPCLQHEQKVRSIKKSAFWNVTPRSLVGIYRRFGQMCCYLYRQSISVGDGDRIFLHNDDTFTTAYTVSYPSVIRKDRLNFVRLYFLNYAWHVNDLHNIWKGGSKFSNTTARALA